MGQAHRGHDLGQMRRLVRVDRKRRPGLDVAEGAGAGAGIAQDHHRRVLLRPALADVRAGRLLAHRVQALVPHQLRGVVIGLGGRRLDADPGRLALDACVRSSRVTWPWLRSEWRGRKRQGRPRASSRTGSGAGRSCGTDPPRWPPWSGDDEALDQLGDFRADHVGAEQLAGLGVEHGLDHALGLAERDRLAVADEREAADLDLVALRPWPRSRSARRSPPAACSRCSRGSWRCPSGAGLDAGDVLDAQHALVAGLVREPGRAGDVADGVERRARRCGTRRRSRCGCGRPSRRCPRARGPRCCR